MPMKIEDKDFFIKDLDIIEDYPIEKILIIDNSVLSFAYHLSNGIPIVPYYEGMEDSELLVLAYYMISLCNYDELCKANMKFIKLNQNFNNEEDIQQKKKKIKKKARNLHQDLS